MDFLDEFGTNSFDPDVGRLTRSILYSFLSFFSDPSSAGVGCAKTGPVQIADNIAKGKEGEVRSENRLSF